jgi:hypothetical protein
MKVGKQTEFKLGWQILIVPICRKRDDDNADLCQAIILRRMWIADFLLQSIMRQRNGFAEGGSADTKRLPLDQQSVSHGQC